MLFHSTVQGHQSDSCPQAHLPFLVDKLDAASADTGVVQGFVCGPLRATHTTNICCRNKQVLYMTPVAKAIVTVTCDNKENVFGCRFLYE